MLLFPESTIKAAVDTLKEVAIDDFRAELYERAVKHLTVALSLDEKCRMPPLLEAEAGEEVGRRGLTVGNRSQPLCWPTAPFLDTSSTLRGDC